MNNIAIVAGGPTGLIPDLKKYEKEINIWIGADRGAYTLINYNITPDIAIGDFDSLNEEEKSLVFQKSKEYKAYSVEKDETDLELAITKAIEQNPSNLYLFGVTGGRLDHGMASIQLLYKLLKKSINGIIIDQSNWLELRQAGKYEITNDLRFPNISFLPFSNEVIGITLQGFYYKLSNENIKWGSTLCISNKLINEIGTFSFNDGILLVIKSRDVLI